MLEDMFSLAFLVGLLASTIRLTTPILLTALGELVTERAGILNLGVEGIMIIGAFAAFVGTYFTGWTLAGLLTALLTGALFGWLMGIVSIRYRANQIVAGIGIWIFCLGLSSYLFRAVFGVVRVRPRVDLLTPLPVPLLSEVPILGGLLFRHNLLVYLAIIIVPLLWFLFRYTSWGLNIDASGEHPRAAESAGVNVSLVRYLSVTAGGALAGLGGAFMVLGLYGVYTDDLTLGLGWMAIVVVFFGKWKPRGVLLGALLFGVANGLQYRLQTIDVPIPYQLLLMLPFVVTLLVVILFVRGADGPSALAEPHRSQD